MYNKKETEALRGELLRKALSLDDVRRVALWKYNRVIEIPDKVLSDVSSVKNRDDVQIDSPEVRVAFESLTSCAGVGVPLASAILKFLRPDVFPIIDVRAYRAIYGRKIYKYTFEVYVDYSRVLYSIALKKGVALEVVDEQLYLFDKLHNGKI